MLNSGIWFCREMTDVTETQPVNFQGTFFQDN